MGLALYHLVFYKINEKQDNYIFKNAFHKHCQITTDINE